MTDSSDTTNQGQPPVGGQTSPGMASLRLHPHRRWWQVLLRVAVVVALSAAAIYVTLPWWAPTGYLRRSIAGDLSSQMGVKVQVGEMSLSWSDGVVLRNLVIGSGEGFGGEPMIVVDEIRTDLSPLTYLFCRRIEWMEIHQPMVYARLSEDGRLNLSPLVNLKTDVQTQRLSIRQAMASLISPKLSRPITVDVGDFQWHSGMDGGIGPMSMSAMLRQNPMPAPVTLRVSFGGSADSMAAEAVFNFVNIDLGQLELPQVTSMPLSRLGGQFSGQWRVGVNRQGVVDTVSFSLEAKNLDIQPVHGPQMPVVDFARFELVAGYDPLLPRITIRSASLNMPGVNLLADGTIVADLTDLIDPHWEQIDSLEFYGVLQPKTLAALLRPGKPPLGNVDIDGPVRVRASVKHEGPHARLLVTADATRACLTRNGSTCKPADRPLSMALRGHVDDRDWRFRADELSLRLGDNTLSGQADVDNIAALLRTDNLSAPALLGSLDGVRWQCNWQISDLASLFELLGRQPPAIDMTGAISGRCIIEQRQGTRVHLAARLDEDMQIRAANLLHKPAGETLLIDAEALVRGDLPGIGDLAIDIACGQGLLEIDAAQLRLTETGSGVASIGGVLRGRRLQHLAALNPLLAARGGIAGDVDGRFSAILQADTAAMQVSADLRKLEFNLAGLLAKADDEPLNITADLAVDSPRGRASHCSLSLRRSAPAGEVALQATHTAGADGSARGTLDAAAEIRDASSIMGSCPLLASALSEAVLGGKATAASKLEYERTAGGMKLWGNISLDAAQTVFISGGAMSRAKPAGVAAAARGSFSASCDGDDWTDIWNASLDELELSLCGSKALVSAAARVDASAGAAKLLEARLNLKAVGRLNEPLYRLVPELGELCDTHGLSGSASLDCGVNVGSDLIEADLVIDAGELAADHLSLLPRDQIQPIIAKYAGLPARLELQASADGALSRIQLRNLRATVGDVGILADGVFHWDGKAVALAPESLHAAAWSTDLRTLEALVPQAAPLRLEGKAFAEMQWREINGGEIPHVHFHTEGIRGRYRGKDLLLAGDLLIEDISTSGKSRIGRIKTDSMELRIGDNHGWLIADLADVLQNPSGEFHLLCDYLHDKDLVDYFSGAPAGADLPPIDPMIQQRSKLLIAVAKGVFDEAVISGRISARRFLNYDMNVDRTYEVNNMELSLGVQRGYVQIAYDLGLNGGLYKRQLSVHLSDVVPMLRSQTELRDVIAAENIQPQLSYQFPGNTVSGYFNRSEDTLIPLQDALAFVLDARHPVRFAGSAKTVTLDGIVEGRSAPEFVTRIFPGLNLTTYRYNKMTGFAEFRADGTAVNDMIFSGPLYDMYVEGTTDADSIGRYEVGLILLGTPQTPEWNHAYRQGRVPLLKFKARIAGGKLHDEEVSYLWPNETLFTVFLKNNIFYRLWVQGRGKQVTP